MSELALGFGFGLLGTLLSLSVFAEDDVEGEDGL